MASAPSDSAPDTLPLLTITVLNLSGAIILQTDVLPGFSAAQLREAVADCTGHPRELTKLLLGSEQLGDSYAFEPQRADIQVQGFLASPHVDIERFLVAAGDGDCRVLGVYIDASDRRVGQELLMATGDAECSGNALYLATKGGHYEAAKLLLEASKELGVFPFPLDWCTATLAAAAKADSLPLLKLLLAAIRSGNLDVASAWS